MDTLQIQMIKDLLKDNSKEKVKGVLDLITPYSGD